MICNLAMQLLNDLNKSCPPFVENYVPNVKISGGSLGRRAAIRLGQVPKNSHLYRKEMLRC